MSRPIEADYKPEFRAAIAQMIKQRGINYARKVIVSGGFSDTFARAMIRSICRKEGW